MTDPHVTAAAILFDLDGVLVDSAAAVEGAWEAWCARHGIDWETLRSVLHGRRARDTVADFAPDLDQDTEVAWLEAEEARRGDQVRPVSGAVDLLARLDGTPWAVVTSGNHPASRTRLEQAGLQVPEVLVAAGDVSAGKPDPEGYRLAAARLGVDPTDCIVFEDTPAGIAAARAAGAVPIGVASTHDPDQLQDASLVVPSLARVRVQTASAAGVTLRVMVGRTRAQH